MKPACPQCFAVVEFEEHGDLFSARCPKCGWKVEGTANRPLFPDVEPGPALVAKAAAPVSAAILKVVREQVGGASPASLDDLRSKLTSGEGLWLGSLPKYKADDLRLRLVAAGAWIEELPHEEG